MQKRKKLTTLTQTLSIFFFFYSALLHVCRWSERGGHRNGCIRGKLGLVAKDERDHYRTRLMRGGGTWANMPCPPAALVCV